MNRLLNAVLDTLIPPSQDGRMPGAGSLGLADSIREQTSAANDVVAAGLTALEASGFVELDLPAREAMLRGLEETQPGFVTTLYVPTCTTYYQHPEALAGLGLEPGPPFPRGYELELGNLEALDRVRARRKIYRDA